MRTKFTGAVVVKALSLVVTFLSTFFLTRLTTQEAFGRYSLLMSIATILTLVVSLGYPQLLIKNVAGYHHNIRESYLLHLWKTSQAWIVKCGGCLIAVSIAWAAFNNFSNNTLEYVIVGFILLVWALLKMYAAYFHGTGQTTIGQVGDILIRPLILLLIILVFRVLKFKEVSPLIILEMNLVAIILSLIGFKAYMHKSGAHYILRQSKGRMQSTKEWITSSLSLSLISGAQLLILNVDILMIGGICSANEVAIYRIAVMLAMVFASLSEVVNVIFRPKFAKAFTEGSLEAITPKLRLALRYSFVAGAMALIAFVIIGRDIVVFFFGLAYYNVYWPAIILIIGQLIGILLGPVEIIQNMTGQESANLNIIVTALLLNVVLNMVLIYVIGVVGAAISSLITICYLKIAGVYIIKKRLYINPTALPF